MENNKSVLEGFSSEDKQKLIRLKNIVDIEKARLAHLISNKTEKHMSVISKIEIDVSKENVIADVVIDKTKYAKALYSDIPLDDISLPINYVGYEQHIIIRSELTTCNKNTPLLNPISLNYNNKHYFKFAHHQMNGEQSVFLYKKNTTIKQLDYPISQIIPNNAESIEQKFDEAIEAVKRFRKIHPESTTNFYLFAKEIEGNTNELELELVLNAKEYIPCVKHLILRYTH
jgi:hypothetical protein